MRNVRVSITLRYYATLPDDEGEADDAIDRQFDAISHRLNDETWPHGVTIVAESFSVVDGDAEPDE